MNNKKYYLITYSRRLVVGETGWFHQYYNTVIEGNLVDCVLAMQIEPVVTTLHNAWEISKSDYERGIELQTARWCSEG